MGNTIIDGIPVGETPTRERKKSLHEEKVIQIIEVIPVGETPTRETKPNY
jgi:hypothetical protein